MGSGSQAAPVRAERLRVALKVWTATDVVPVREAGREGLLILTKWEQAGLNDPSDEDLALLNACLELECELRAREFATVERLLALVAAGGGALGDRVLALAGDDLLGAL